MRRRRSLPPFVLAAWGLAALIVAVLTSAVLAHLASPDPGAHEHPLFRTGDAPEGTLLSRNLVTAWQLDAASLGVVVLLGAFYLTAVGLRGSDPDVDRWPLARTLSFLAGLGVVAFATNGSIAVYDQVLFTGHMLGHLALVMVAPALIMAGNPVKLAVEASREPLRGRLLRVLQSRAVSLIAAPPVALALYAVVIVGSHLTGLMDVVMQNEWAGQIEHVVYLVSGCIFFGLIVGEHHIRWVLAVPLRWTLLAVAMAVDTFTGIVLLMSTTPVAMVPAPGVPVNPLSDTRTGGAIMWVGGDGIMALIMVVLAVGWIRGDRPRGGAGGWLEQARRAEFSSRVGGTEDTRPEAVEEFDEDAENLAAYNAWLASMADKKH